MNEVLDNPAHEIWPKLILNNHVVMTRTYLARNIKKVKSAVRNACIQRLVEMGVLIERRDILTGEPHTFLKRPPTHTGVQTALVYFKIDIMDYEASFNEGNPFIFLEDIGTTQRAQIKRPADFKGKFRLSFHRFLAEDQWYSRHVFLADGDVETADELQPLSTSSSTGLTSHRLSSRLLSHARVV